MTQRHGDPMIAAFLEEGGYEDIDAWMNDSDYYEDSDGNWEDEDGNSVSPIGAIEGAMEASGFIEKYVDAHR